MAVPVVLHGAGGSATSTPRHPAPGRDRLPGCWPWRCLGMGVLLPHPPRPSLALSEELAGLCTNPHPQSPPPAAVPGSPQGDEMASPSAPRGGRDGGQPECPDLGGGWLGGRKGAPADGCRPLSSPFSLSSAPHLDTSPPSFLLRQGRFPAVTEISSTPRLSVQAAASSRGRGRGQYRRRRRRSQPCGGASRGDQFLLNPPTTSRQPGTGAMEPPLSPPLLRRASGGFV